MDNFLTTPELSTGESYLLKLFIFEQQVQQLGNTWLNNFQVFDKDGKSDSVHRKLPPLLLLLI